LDITKYDREINPTVVDFFYLHQIFLM